MLIPVAFEIAKGSYARFATGEPFCVFEELFSILLYKLRIASCSALPQSYRYSRFRRVSHGFTLIPVAFEIAKGSYARFACDEPYCVFEELIQ